MTNDIRAKTVRDEVLGRGNFKPIKISSGRPHFTISKAGILLNVGATKALEGANCVRALINKATGELMLVKCDEAAESCIKLHTNKSGGRYLFYKELWTVVAKHLGFNGALGSVRVLGRRVPGAAAVIFDLKEVRRNGV